MDAAKPIELMGLAFDAAPCGILVVDDQGFIHLANTTTTELFGYPPAELVGQRVDALLPERFRESLAAGFARFADSPTRRLIGNETELCGLHKDGSEFPLEIEISDLKTASGMFTVAIVSDTSVRADARKRARDLEAAQHLEALESAEERYALAVSATSDGIWDWNIITNAEYFAPRWCEILGYAEDDPSLTRTYDSWAARIHPDDRERVEQALGAHLADRVPYDVTYRHQHKSGEYRWQNSRGQALYNDEGKPVRMVGAIRDVTESVYAHEKEIELERKLQAEEEHAKLSARLQQAQKMESLAVLAGGIAHDFNNLLVGILGNAGLARSMLTSASPAMEYVRDIETASHEAAQLVHQMLAYSGRGHFVIETLDLNALVEETTSLLSAVISKQAVLKYDLEASLPPIHGDASQIRQVLMNLITNASDAIGKKSGVIAISTGVIDADATYLADTDFVGKASETYVFVEISDTGCGMDAETREKIFDPFFSTKPEGHGLGLAAVLGIMRGHKGAIKIYSEVNQGTTFKVMFPPDPAAEVKASKLSPSIGGKAFRGEGLVLVIDDNETVCGVTKRVLQSVGFTVVTASDGRQGIATYKERREDNIVCVLLDLTMPHMDGLESFRLLRQENPDVRVLLMSGYNEAEAINQFVGKGLAGFLHKPFTPEQVVEGVRDVLELGRAEAE